MSAVPFTATTCCQTGTERKSASAASQPAGAPKSRRPRSNASQIAEPEEREVEAEQEIVRPEAVGRRGRGAEEGLAQGGAAAGAARPGDHQRVERRLVDLGIGDGRVEADAPGAEERGRLGVVDARREPLPRARSGGPCRPARAWPRSPRRGTASRRRQARARARRRRGPRGGPTACPRPSRASGSAPASCAGGRSFIDARRARATAPACGGACAG